MNGTTPKEPEAFRPSDLRAWAIVSDGIRQYIGRALVADSGAVELVSALEWRSSLVPVNTPQGQQMARQQMASPIEHLLGVDSISILAPTSIIRLDSATDNDLTRLHAIVVQAHAMREAIRSQISPIQLAHAGDIPRAKRP